MKTIQYETTGGIVRQFSAEYVGRNKSNTATIWLAENGNTYEWYWETVIDWNNGAPIFADDVIRVSSNKSCSRFLGIHAKHITQNED